MIKPQFPFLGNQIILSSDRIMLHSKSDGIFLFGKGAVSLSSPQTINLDSKEKVLVYSPSIELGNGANDPVVKGYELTVILLQLLLKLDIAAIALGKCAAGGNTTPELAASMQNLASAGKELSQESKRLINVLGLTPDTNPIMSKTTVTI
mgnify:CR=1 FL=1